MSIHIGAVFVSICEELPLQGFNRVLQVLEGEDMVVLIQVPDGPRKNEGSKQNNYYVRGFFTRSLTEMIEWEDKKLIRETTVSWPAIWSMSDDAIREAFPPKKGKAESHILSERDRKWELIKPLLSNQEYPALINLMELYKNAGFRAIEAKVSKGQVLDALHRYYAFGCIRNSLLPNTAACGASGVQRISKNGKKLGRRNAAAVVGNFGLQGKILTEDDRQNLADGWAMFVRPGTTVSEAFFALSSAFYNKGYSLKHGWMVPNLLDAHLRPTEREFRYHGPLATDGTTAARRLMGEGEWLKNHRELNGTSRTGVMAFGQVGSIDASPIDVNLVSCVDRLLPIGVGRAIVVTDVQFGLVLGWHVAIGGIGTDEANLAILNAALRKDEMLKRYDLDMPPEDFPSIFCSKFLSDNGELRAIKGIGATVEKLQSRIEFIPSGRADRNSSSESGHHSRHRGLDHHLEGTTKGRQSKRGEPLPISKALLSHYEYSRLLIQWIHWKNTKQEVHHLLTIEMRRDRVQPTRIAIYRWAKKNGYVAGRPVDPTYLKAHLLPTFTASIQRNGLVLHRPKNGDAVELLNKVRFNANYLAISGLIRAALNGGKKHIEVKANPDDLSQVFIFDVNGVHVINNISDDVLLVHEGCIADLSAINEMDRQKKIEMASPRDQDMVEMRSFRVEQEAESKREKEFAMGTEKSKSKAKTDRSSVRKNQVDERRAKMDEAVQRASATATQNNMGENSPDTSDSSDRHEDVGSAEQPKVNDVVALMRGKLKKFHSRRGI